MLFCIFVDLFPYQSLEYYLHMETVYRSHDEVQSFSAGIVSERVQNLASGVYREFEVMMNTYGDGVINNLMPQVVTILESLNQAYREKQEHEVELELLHVENDNLKVQFEREKQLRQSNEQVALKRLMLQLYFALCILLFGSYSLSYTKPICLLTIHYLFPQCYLYTSSHNSGARCNELSPNAV